MVRIPDGMELDVAAPLFFGFPKTGNINAGLLIICYSRNPDEQFIPMLKLMQNQDKLNEYTSHISSGMFACPGGLKEGQYAGQSLLES